MVPEAAALALAAGALALAIWTAVRVLSALRQTQEDAARDRTVRLLALFAPGMAAAASDPRILLSWQPLAAAARVLFPSEFAGLDRAVGTAFPFSTAQIEDAHARWTADWLAWEDAHDREYKLKAAALEQDLGLEVSSAAGRARVEAVTREKLERYQRRYEDYRRVSKALRALLEDPPRSVP